MGNPLRRSPSGRFDEAVEELLEEGRPTASRRPGRRHTSGELLVGASFLATVAAMLALLPAERSFSVALAAAFVVAYALTTRVRFDVGAGYTVPTELLLVPMLFALPAKAVPLVVVIGLLVGDLPDYLSGRRHVLRAVHALGDAWHSVGPALVLALFASGGPEWSSWPIYVAALGAQLFVDLTASTARELLGRGVTPKIQLGVLGWVYLIDVVLAPVGLLAAFASTSQRYAFLLVLPLAALLVVLARERRARIENALDLSRAYRETSELNARLLDTERRARRQREHLIAGASHEMQTPLAVMLGLNEVLSNRDLPSTERAELHEAMERQLMLLRHLVRQFIDYTRLKSGDRLTTDPRPARIAPIVEQVVEVQRGDTPFEVHLPEDLPPAVVDPARLRQILMNLVSNAVKFSPPGAPVKITARSDPDSIELAVIDQGPGVRPADEGEIFVEAADSNGDTSPGAGIGLYMARVLSETQGAVLRVRSEPGEGSRFEVVLQRA